MKGGRIGPRGAKGHLEGLVSLRLQLGQPWTLTETMVHVAICLLLTPQKILLHTCRVFLLALVEWGLALARRPRDDPVGVRSDHPLPLQGMLTC